MSMTRVLSQLRQISEVLFLQGIAATDLRCGKSCCIGILQISFFVITVKNCKSFNRVTIKFPSLVFLRRDVR